MVGCSLGGERWDGKEEERETEEESVRRGGVYNGFYRWTHRQNVSVGDSIGDSVMSLYGYLSLNPSVIPSVKSSEQTPRHHAVASFQTKCIVRRRYGRYIHMEYYRWYIPTVSSMELVRRYIPSDFEMEFSLSVITTDGIFSLVIPLVSPVFWSCSRTTATGGAWIHMLSPAKTSKLVDRDRLLLLFPFVPAVDPCKATQQHKQ